MYLRESILLCVNLLKVNNIQFWVLSMMNLISLLLTKKVTSLVHDIELDTDWSDSEQKIQVNTVYGNSVCVSSTYLHSCSLLTFQEEPLTYQETTTGTNLDKWGPPIQVELEAMRKYSVGIFSLRKMDEADSIEVALYH